MSIRIFFASHWWSFIVLAMISAAIAALIIWTNNSPHAGKTIRTIVLYIAEIFTVFSVLCGILSFVWSVEDVESTSIDVPAEADGIVPVPAKDNGDAVSSRQNKDNVCWENSSTDSDFSHNYCSHSVNVPVNSDGWFCAMTPDVDLPTRLNSRTGESEIYNGELHLVNLHLTGTDCSSADEFSLLPSDTDISYTYHAIPINGNMTNEISVYASTGEYRLIACHITEWHSDGSCTSIPFCHGFVTIDHCGDYYVTMN